MLGDGSGLPGSVGSDCLCSELRPHRWLRDRGGAGAPTWVDPSWSGQDACGGVGVCLREHVVRKPHRAQPPGPAPGPVHSGRDSLPHILGVDVGPRRRPAGGALDHDREDHAGEHVGPEVGGYPPG